jgi:hypothetical protein
MTLERDEFSIGGFIQTHLSGWWDSIGVES